MSLVQRLSVVPLCLAVTLAGCGTTVMPAVQTVTPTNVTGNWQIGVNLPITTPPALPTNPVGSIFGSLSSTGTSVTGILHADPLGSPTAPACTSAVADISATGTIDTSGNLALTFPLSGGVATITANLASRETVTLSNGIVRTEPYYAGTYQVVGGPCAQPSIGLTITPIPNLTGSYTGTFTQTPSVTGTPSAVPSTVAVTLLEAATPNADGEYPLSGTFTSTGACNFSFSFTQGIVAGDNISSYSPLFSSFPLPPFIPPIVFTGIPNPGTAPPSLLGSFFGSGTGCGSPGYSGTLVPQ